MFSSPLSGARFAIHRIRRRRSKTGIAVETADDKQLACAPRTSTLAEVDGLRGIAIWSVLADIFLFLNMRRKSGASLSRVQPLLEVFLGCGPVLCHLRVRLGYSPRPPSFRGASKDILSPAHSEFGRCTSLVLLLIGPMYCMGFPLNRATSPTGAISFWAKYLDECGILGSVCLWPAVVNRGRRAVYILALC